jgi:copper chaperone
VAATAEPAAAAFSLYIPHWGIVRDVSQALTYTVAAMHCGHCELAVREAVAAVPGVSAVDVDLETKLVTVAGASLADSALRAAIEEAGYEAAQW